MPATKNELEDFDKRFQEKYGRGPLDIQTQESKALNIKSTTPVQPSTSATATKTELDNFDKKFREKYGRNPLNIQTTESRRIQTPYTTHLDNLTQAGAASLPNSSQERIVPGQDIRLKPLQEQYDTASRRLDVLNRHKQDLQNRSVLMNPQEYKRQLDETERQIEQMKSLQGGAANQLYYENNQEQLDRIQNSTTAAIYEAGRNAKKDQQTILQLMAPNAQNQPGYTEAVQKISEAYGVSPQTSGTDYQQRLQELYNQLEDTRKKSRRSVNAAGFDYDRLEEYEERIQADAENAKARENVRAFAKEHPVAASALSVAVQPAAGLDYLQQVIGNLGRNDAGNLDTYRPMSADSMTISNFVSDIRGSVSEEIEKNTDWDLFGQNVASFLYQTGMSVADSALMIGAMGNGASLLMGLSAASQTASDALSRGATNGQAVMAGFAAGAAEMLFEKFSIDQLLKPKSVTSVKRLLQETMKQAGVEASEEGATEIANILTDAAIMGESSNFSVAVENYKAQGMSESEARKQAYLDMIGQVGWAAAGGALSGGVMGGVVNTARFGPERRAAKAVKSETNRLNETAQDIDEDIRPERQDPAAQTPESVEAYQQEISKAMDQQEQRLRQQARQASQEANGQEQQTEQPNVTNTNSTSGLVWAGSDIKKETPQTPTRYSARQSPGQVVDSASNSENIGLENQALRLMVEEDAYLQQLKQQYQAGELTDAQFDAAYDRYMERNEGLRQAMEAATAEDIRGEKHETTDLERSGLNAGVDVETIRQAQRLSRAIGRDVVFYNEAAASSGTQNGYYNPTDGKIYVNAQSADPVPQIIAHELTHSVELAESYGRLSEIVLRRIRRTEDLQQLRRQKAELYARNGVQLRTEEDIDKEIVAEYVERNLLTDEQSIMELVHEDRSLGVRILNWLNRLLAKIGNKNAQERVFLTQVRDAYRKALREIDAMEQTTTESVQRSSVRTTGNAAQEDGVDRYSINPSFSTDIQEWYEDGQPGGERFVLGSTGPVLQGLGAIESDIYINGDKVSTILQQHPEMTIREIQRIPEILENPVFVLKSRNVHSARSQYGNSRLTLFGSVKARDGRPVMCVMDLRPTENGFLLDDMQKVNSAYTKDTNPVKFVQASDVLYANKNRTIPLLRGMGFQMPMSLLQNGSIGSITYEGQKVNLAGIPFPSVVEVGNVQYSLKSTDSKEQEKTEQEAQPRKTIETIPAKAQQYLRQAERQMVNRIGSALGVPRQVQRDYLQEIARQISEEYLQTGAVSQQTVGNLFETAYQQGVVADEQLLQDYREVRDYLRSQAISISRENRADIADFEDFRKRAFGLLRLTNEDGIPVDTAYQELQEMAPGLFPQHLIHPADQLQKMYEIANSLRRSEKSLDEYYGTDAEQFKAWAQRDFENAIYDNLQDLKIVKRYVEQDRGSERDATPQSMEEIKDAYAKLKDARRVYERTMAKHLLTAHDQQQVMQILRGELTEEELDASKSNVKGIHAVVEAKQRYNELTSRIKQYNAKRKLDLRKEADDFLRTASGWKDKSAGILYARETMERNFRDVIPDKALAERMIKRYLTPVHEAAAHANKLKNEYRNRVRDLNLSTKETKRDLEAGRVSEAHAVQLLGEAEDNIRMLEQGRGRLKERDGKTALEWQQTIEELWRNNPQLNRKKIENAVLEFREIYDELFQKINDARVRNGYEPMNYRNGYFPHFQKDGGDGLLKQIGRTLGIETEVTALPTSINGMTYMFRPGIQWFSNAQQRRGYDTAFDAVEGFDRYIEGAADVIFQTDNIQALRALAQQIRYRTTDDGIRDRIDAVRNNLNSTDDEMEGALQEIYRNGRFELSNFAAELDEYTNLLANKKSRSDRNMEQMFGRKSYNLVKALESRVAANMVAINPASWLTNFIPLTQGNASLGRTDLLHGMLDALRSYKESDGFVERSTFLTNRRGSDPIIQAWSRGLSQKMALPMEYIDHFTADSLVRARYRQDIRRGMSEEDAMQEADAWAASLIADRSKGSMPTIFSSVNPLTKMFTQFQLEVNNQLSYLGKDLPREMRDRGIAALVAALLKFFLGAWLFDEVYEYFIGRRPALDPLGILNDTVGDLTGYKLPNLVEMGMDLTAGDVPSFETEKENAHDTVTALLKSAAEELPFVGGVLGGGRLPVSNAFPSAENLLKAAFSDNWSREKRLNTVGKELINPLSYLLLPFGGGQIKKLYQGMKAVLDGGSYTVDADGNDILQYPVYTDTTSQKISAILTAAIFGKSSLQTATEWVDSGFKSMSARETAAYQGMTEAGVDGETANELIVQLRDVKKTEEEGETEQKLHLLEGSGISQEGIAAAYYSLIASETDRALMDQFAEQEANMGEVADVLIGIQDVYGLEGAAASNAKRSAILAADLTDAQKKAIYREKISDSRDDDISAFERAGIDFDHFLEAQSTYAAINEEYSGSSEKAFAFSRWVNQQGFSEEEAATVKEAFKYYSQIPAEAKLYDELTVGGMSDAAAAAVSEAIDELEPLTGNEKVTSLQKYRAVVNENLSESDTQAALLSTMSDSQGAKFSVAAKAGITSAQYVGYLETADIDGSGSVTQAEAQTAISEILGLTTKQRAILWQLQNKSWKNKNNPFGASGVTWDTETGAPLLNGELVNNSASSTSGGGLTLGGGGSTTERTTQSTNFGQLILGGNRR